MASDYTHLLLDHQSAALRNVVEQLMATCSIDSDTAALIMGTSDFLEEDFTEFLEACVPRLPVPSLLFPFLEMELRTAAPTWEALAQDMSCLHLIDVFSSGYQSNIQLDFGAIKKRCYQARDSIEYWGPGPEATRLVHFTTSLLDAFVSLEGLRSGDQEAFVVAGEISAESAVKASFDPGHAMSRQALVLRACLLMGSGVQGSVAWRMAYGELVV